MVEHRIDAQGDIHIESAYVVDENEDFALLVLDAREKYPEVFATGGQANRPDSSVAEPMVALGVGAGTLRGGVVMSPEATLMTVVTFPSFPDWEVWATTTSRYDVLITLWRRGWKGVIESDRQAREAAGE